MLIEAIGIDQQQIEDLIECASKVSARGNARQSCLLLNQCPDASPINAVFVY
jgi:hypothetical protein